MKGIRLLFAACLAPLAFHGAIADDAGDIARAAARRGPVGITTGARQKTTTDQTQQSGRTVLSAGKNATASRDRAPQSSATTARTTVTARDTDSATPPHATQNVSSRSNTSVLSRGTVSSPMATTPQRTGTGRAATTQTRAAITTAAPATPASPRVTTTRTGAKRTTSGGLISRAADSQTAANRDAILNRDATKCRKVYYSCMDEFCANKDAQLKRCACSSRLHEFDNVKKSLAAVEDKMLSFNQRLLTVSMDKEDAEALYKATEGELAYNQKDTSTSKKLLDEISKKLNTTFNNSNFDRSLNAISLSLNTDAAFDTVDSLQGASATAKSGTELYAAALPVCREMSREVCTSDELDIAESGYQMQIEQDCNTVSKAYQTQADQARTKVREGGALLDMSRLNIYQQRNADDILTCKKKMLDMLTDSTVCGTNMGKCLDTTGRYIDPSTGEAFLTPNLVDLSKLITRPTAGTTWTSAAGNDKFILFLNSKKKFLEPAMEHCQNIADAVWDEFIEDALAQIKLAQDNKLEEMRQSCTTLTTQCLSDSAKTLSDFDARALSTFGVMADKTVNAMCADINTACTALLKQTGGDDNWQTGMSEIATTKTYDTILQTCREVGRACIIQACTSISGNFGLCEDIQTSINRKSIINRTACWAEVKDCIASAGDEKINDIYKKLVGEDEEAVLNGTYTYHALYGTDITNSATTLDAATISECMQGGVNKDPKNCVYDICLDECYTAKKEDPADQDKITGYETKNSNKCKICRLAEQIWGNCEIAPTVDLYNDGLTAEQQSKLHNQIKIPTDNDYTKTLMAWFAKNTGTAGSVDSCRDTSCGPGYSWTKDITQKDKDAYYCALNASKASSHQVCENPNTKFEVYKNFTNCCDSPYTLKEGICCQFGNKETTQTGEFSNIENVDICKIADNYTSYKIVADWTTQETATTNTFVTGTNILICADGLDTTPSEKKEGYPNGKQVKCKGKWLLYNPTKKTYINPANSSDQYMYYDEDKERSITVTYSTSDGWGDKEEMSGWIIGTPPTTTHAP